MMMWPPTGAPPADMMAAWNFQPAEGSNPYGGLFFHQGPQGGVMPFSPPPVMGVQPMAFSPGAVMGGPPPPGAPLAFSPGVGMGQPPHPGAQPLMGSPPGLPMMQPVMSGKNI